MIRRETVIEADVARRRGWVELSLGGIVHLLAPAEAVALADRLVDASEVAA